MNKFKNLYDKYDNFNNTTLDCICKNILKGCTPQEAAAEAGISTRTFNKWMEDESFADFINTHVQKMSASYKGVIHDAMENAVSAEDYKEAASIAMKNLERLNKKYGAKHLDVKEERTVLPDPDIDEELDDIVKEAEKHANEQSTD